MNGTLPPSVARMREFRKRGDVARSRDAVGAMALTGAIAGLLATGSTSWTAMTEFTEWICRNVDSDENAADFAAHAAAVGLRIVSPVLLAAVVAALLCIALQLGWPPAWRPWLRGRHSQPATGHLQDAFAPSRIASRAASTVAKLVALSVLTAAALRHGESLHAASIPQLLHSITTGAAALLAISALAFLALGAVDYQFARRRVAVRLKMTPEELRREVREQEGDPSIKARRDRQRQLRGQRRLDDAVSESTMIVTNPGPVAVALRYRAGADSAPTLMAKGRSVLADQIISLARARSIPVVSEPELAHALQALPVGAAVPVRFYRATAQALARTHPEVKQAPP